MSSPTSFASRRNAARSGFTLIELLIVVVILAILAAIGLPNLLQAQSRARISRARSDLRTYAAAIEAYTVDNQRYPTSTTFLAHQDLAALSSPVAYLTSAELRDPFGTPRVDVASGQTDNTVRGYTYAAYDDRSSFFNFAPSCCPGQKVSVCSVVRRKAWSVASQGPNLRLDGAAELIFRLCPMTNPEMLAALPDRIYDPTNGTISSGDLIRFGGDISEL